MVVGAANSATRKRSRPSGSAGSAGRDSRVAERPEGMADPATEEQVPAAGAADREELVVVPSPDLSVEDLSVELAVVDLDDADDLEDALRLVLSDAQTSGGLLIAIPPAGAERVLADLSDLGTVATIGEVLTGPPGAIIVR